MPHPRAPFTERPTRSRLIGRLLKRPRPADAFIEVNNLFARTAHVRGVTAADIEAIFERHAISWDTAPAAARNRIYRDYLYYCLADRHLTADELADLDHIRTLLRLESDAVDLVHRRVTREVYSRTVDVVLADATVDEEERRFLAQLRDNLRIPDHVADNILEVKQRQRSRREAAAGERDRRRG
jgi:hypothetical protein